MQIETGTQENRIPPAFLILTYLLNGSSFCYSVRMGGDEEQDAEQRHEGGDQGRVHDGGGCGRAVREEVHHDLPERLLTPSPASDHVTACLLHI